MLEPPPQTAPTTHKSSYKDVSSQKKRVREEAIKDLIVDNNFSELFASDAKAKFSEYLAAGVAQIVRNIKQGKWTAVEVVTAYIQRAITAQEATNCLTEVVFRSALSEAKALDEEFQRTGQLRGPFHGVPFSAKDCCDVGGTDTTIGFTRWADSPSHRDCEPVKLIRQAGGILLAKTNVPQTLLSFECSNPLWGRSLHPLSAPEVGKKLSKISAKLTDAERRRPFTCGGSSGGESALLACDGAALGLGSDIGGSLRIPAAFCGVYTLKPSQGRTSSLGMRTASPGFEAITICQGPIGRSVEDIRMASKVLLGKLHSKVPIPYRDEVAISMKGKKLRFGYYISDGFVKASPACQRAVMQTIEALRREGHECTLFTPPDVHEAMRIFVGLTSADGYETRLSHLGPDPQEDSLFLVTLGPKLPGPLRALGAWAIQNIVGDELFANSFRDSRRKPVREFMEFAAARDNYNLKFEKEVWDKLGFDGIICPVLASPAFAHGATRTLSPLAVATILYNVVESSVGVVPVTTVQPLHDKLSEKWLAGSSLSRNAIKLATEPSEHVDIVDVEEDTGPHGSKLIERNLYQSSQGYPAVYDADVMDGLPVGVQIVGRIHEDEKVVEMMRIVDEALGPREFFGPGSSTRYFS